MNLEKTKKVLGMTAVIKNIHKDTLTEIIISSNCSEDMESKIVNLAKINKIPIKKTEEDSKTLGILCKKTFNVSMLGVLKE